MQDESLLSEQYNYDFFFKNYLKTRYLVHKIHKMNGAKATAGRIPLY